MVSTLLALYQKFLFLLPWTLVKKKKKEMLLRILQWNIIGVRNPIACSADYSDDTRLARAASCKRIPPFNSASPADCIEPNFVGGCTSGSQICMCRRVYAHSRSGRKGFYRYEFNFHTNSSGRSFSLDPSHPPPPLSLCPSYTRRTECYVPMQTWFAGYLERNKGGEHSSTAPYPGWLSVIQ